ncbi:UNVERIFIED_CONTAM: hypothetical protein B566_EDAN018856 [Ephemera danica]|nr:hypothetical protein B566_EDAN018856 [Ephemera danica]
MVDKYRNTVRLLVNKGVILNLRKRKAQDITNEQEPDIDAEQSRLWLVHSRMPLVLVYEHWEKSRALRKPSNSHDDIKNVYDFLNYWPILKQSDSYTLVDLDFKDFYPDSYLALLSKWEQIKAKLIPILKRDVKDKSVIASLDLLPTTEGAGHDLIVLRAIAGVCLPTNRVNKSSVIKPWKPSIKESQDGFILHVKQPGDIKPSIAIRTAKFQSLKRQVQPFVIAVGPTLSSLDKFYVYICSPPGTENRIVMYELDSLLKAVDICFKVFFCMSLEYGKDSEQLWNFLQKGVYNITTKYDNSFPSVNDLLLRLK